MVRWMISLLLLLGLVTAPGAEAAQTAYLDSSPMGARIVLDGVLTEFRTPAVLRDLTPGPHTVSFWKDGFIQITQSFRVSEDRVAQVRATLPPTTVVLAFPANDEVSNSQTPLPTAGRQFRYPGGAYFLSAVDEMVRMTPIFPDAGLLDTAGWSLVLTAGSAALTGTLDYFGSGSPSISKLTMALGAAAVADAAWYVGLQTRKARYYQETAPAVSPEPQRLDRALALFNQGEEALQTGELGAAEADFVRLVRDYPDSRWVPGAWFRLAKIHSITGRGSLAKGEYRLVAETFPQAAYHDRARKALADLYEASGKPELALHQLDRMVLADDYFDAEALAEQRTRLAAAVPAEEPGTGSAAPTPRQSYERTLTLFGLGHPFTAEEITGFETLKDRLAEVGDADLVADLALVRVAVSAAASAAETKDSTEWQASMAAARDRQAWLSIRDAGIVTLGLSTTASLLAAVSYDRHPTDTALAVMGGSMGAMGLSLFPLLWAEPRQ